MGIKESIRKLATQEHEIYSQICIVESVDKAARTVNVKPIVGDAEIFNCRLQSTPGAETGLVIYPKVNSYVIVTFINKVNAYVAMTDEVDHVEWLSENGFHIGGPKYNMTEEMNAFIDIVKGTLETLEGFQLSTNQGPTIQVMPHIKSKLSQLKNDLSQFENHLNTILT